MSVTRVSFVSIAFRHHYCAADTEQTMAASCPLPKPNLHYVGMRAESGLVRKRIVLIVGKAKTLGVTQILTKKEFQGRCPTFKPCGSVIN